MRAELPDVGLARAAHAADRDPRPRRGAARRASSRTRSCSARSLEIVEAEAQRLERLVGDILDLAKLDAHRFTVLDARRSTWSSSSSRPTRRSASEARRAVDRLSAVSVDATPGDRLRRRPRAADRRQPALERVPGDAGRRPDRARARRRRTARCTSRSRTPGRGSRAEQRERLFRPFVSGDGGGTGPRARDRAELSHALGGRIELDSELGRGLAVRARAAGRSGGWRLAARRPRERARRSARRRRARARSGRGARSAPASLR